MPTVQVDGESIRYRLAEADQPFAPRVVMLHMAGGSSLTWSAVLRVLGGRCSVFAPDFPAHGQSQGVARGSIEDLALFADRFCEVLGLGLVHVAGHSMGGAVALAWALQHPSRLCSLTLVSTSARLSVAPVIFDFIDKHFDQLGSLMGGAARASGSSDQGSAEAVFPQADHATVRLDFEACQVFDVSSELHRIDQPSLVVVGRDDALTPVSWSQRLTQGLACARLEIIEACGHLLPREAARPLAEMIRGLVLSGLE